MNDNDIIKLLKVCSTASGCKACLFADSTDCAGEVSAMALELINRQKAEIERLNHIRAELSKDIAALREKGEFLERVEAARIEAEELYWEREEVLAQSDKERQEAEAFERLMQIAEITEGEDENL